MNLIFIIFPIRMGRFSINPIQSIRLLRFGRGENIIGFIQSMAFILGVRIGGVELQILWFLREFTTVRVSFLFPYLYKGLETLYSRK